MMNDKRLNDEPAQFRNVQIPTIRRRCSKAEAQKTEAAEVLSQLPKPMRCVYTQSGKLVATFRYLDESDYKAFAHVRGFYNAVVSRRDRAPYLDNLMQLEDL